METADPDGVGRIFFFVREKGTKSPASCMSVFPVRAGAVDGQLFP